MSLNSYEVHLITKCHDLYNEISGLHKKRTDSSFSKAFRTESESVKWTDTWHILTFLIGLGFCSKTGIPSTLSVIFLWQELQIHSLILSLILMHRCWEPGYLINVDFSVSQISFCLPTIVVIIHLYPLSKGIVYGRYNFIKLLPKAHG